MKTPLRSSTVSVKKSWISYHIYYQDDADMLLRRLQPFVAQLIKKGQISQFFFIRYSDERGLHIRLRLLPAAQAMRPRIRHELKAAFPGGRYVRYTPETTRYGGPHGVPIAEQLFNDSSAAVLQLLGSTKNWSQQRAIASALQMHIGMLQAFGVSRQEAAALMAHISESPSVAKDTIERFEKAFMMQRDAVAIPLSNLWSACEAQAAFADSWFIGWRQAMAKMKAQLLTAYTADKLILPNSSVHDSPLWTLYESYIHMTNNRLGVKRADEPFAAYVLYRSLSES